MRHLFDFCDILKALMQLRKGSLTAQELCHNCLQKLKYTRNLNIYITEIQQDAILTAAESSTQSYRQGTPSLMYYFVDVWGFRHFCHF